MCNSRRLVTVAYILPHRLSRLVLSERLRVKNLEKLLAVSVTHGIAGSGPVVR
jgi:hypothetical protein